MKCTVCGGEGEGLMCLEGFVCDRCLGAVEHAIALISVGERTFTFPIAGFWKKHLEEHGPFEPVRRLIGRHAA